MQASIFLATILCAVVNIYGSAQINGVNGEEDLHTSKSDAAVLFDEFWKWLIQTNPESSTWIGLTTCNEDLRDLSLESILNEYNMTHHFNERAKQLQMKSTDPDEKEHLAYMIQMLEIFNDGQQNQGYLLPLNYMIGVHTNLREIFDRMPNKTNADIFHMVKRLQKFPLQIQQTIQLMQKGVEEGIVNHAVSMNQINDTINQFIVSNPEDSPSYKYFQNDWLPQDSNATVVQPQVKQAIKKISDSLEILRDFIATNYTTRPDVAVTSMAGGKEFYEACVRFYLPGMTIQEIHDMGLKEVDRVVMIIKMIITEMGHEGMSIKEFSELVKSDGSNYYNTSEEIVAACENLIHDRIQPKLADLFNKFPKSPVKVTGDSNPSVGAHYRIASFDGTKPGQFLIGTANLKRWPKYVLPSLTLHEANPGHHFQISLKNEDETMPMFRKYSGSFSSYGMVPSTFPWYASFTEGWGLYAEYLGLEMGVYETPLEKFGHYMFELLRAIRLVVDTGMHALGWTREQAIAYSAELLPYDRAVLELQIDRYITFPGQALNYKPGQLEILRWRREAEKSLGSKMDIKEFHDVILSNPSDLKTIEAKVQSWVQEKQKMVTSDQSKPTEESHAKPS